jgi:hypothetical protein
MLAVEADAVPHEQNEKSDNGAQNDVVHICHHVEPSSGQAALRTGRKIAGHCLQRTRTWTNHTFGGIVIRIMVERTLMACSYRRLRRQLIVISGKARSTSVN